MNEFKRTCCIDIDKAFPPIKPITNSSTKKDISSTTAGVQLSGSAKKDMLSNGENNHLDN